MTDRKKEKGLEAALRVADKYADDLKNKGLSQITFFIGKSLKIQRVVTTLN